MKAAALLKWLNDNCFEFDFVLKMDDDVYINSWNLAIALAKLSPLEDKIYERLAIPLSYSGRPYRIIPPQINSSSINSYNIRMIIFLNRRLANGHGVFI